MLTGGGNPGPSRVLALLLLNLAVFIGSGRAQSVQLGLLPQALAAGGTALLVILTAVGQTGAAMRGSVATALRKGED